MKLDTKDTKDNLTIIVLQGGQGEPCEEWFSEKCPCLKNNNIASINQVSLFDTVFSHFKYLKSVGQNRDLAQLAPPPPQYN